MVLLNEILSNPASQYADQIRNVVDVVFALASEDSGLVGSASDGAESNIRSFRRGGSEVWKYLARLRARAWRKKNWDPVNPLSREQATTLCQRWSASVEQSIVQAEAVPDTASSTAQPFATTSEDFTIPTTGFLGEDLLYSEDLDLQNYPPGTELFEDAQGSWLDDL